MNHTQIEQNMEDHDKQTTQKDEPKGYDHAPAWKSFSSPSRSDVIASIRLACPVSLSQAIASAPQKLPSEVAATVIECWPERSGLVHKAISKAEVSDDFLALVLSRRVEYVRYLLQRKDLSSEHLLEVAKAVSALLPSSRYELLLELSQHPSCDRRLVEYLWQNFFSLRHLVFHAASLPRVIQDESLSSDSVKEKHLLLQHPSTPADIRRKAAESLVESDDYDFILAATNSGHLDRELLAGLVVSPDVRVAVASSDHIATVASLVRIRDYTRRHVGSSHSAVNAIVADQIRRRLPLGWFPAACFLLRAAFQDKVAAVAPLLSWVSTHPRAANVRSIAWCEKDRLERFQSVLLAIPEQPRQRLLVASLKAEQLTSDLLNDFYELSSKPGFNEHLSAFRWKGAKDLFDVQVELRAKIELAKLRNFYIRPQRRPFWSWVSRLHRRKIGETYKICIPRSAAQIRRWSIELRNCLNSHQYAERFRAGDIIVVGVMSGRRVVYAAEVVPRTGLIIQLKGVKNCSAPMPIRVALTQLIADVRNEQSADEAPAVALPLAPDGLLAW